MSKIMYMDEEFSSAIPIDVVVKKAGDTMHGGLSYVHPTIDASKSNNGVDSGTEYPTTFDIRDNGGRILARCEARVNSDGNNGFYLYARNYDTSGSQVAQFGIGIDIDKTGQATYILGKPLFVRKKVEMSQTTLEAYSAISLNLIPTVNANAPSGGYTALGIIGFSTNNGQVVMQSARLQDWQYGYECKNISSSSQTIRPEVWILYAANGIFRID